MDQSIGIIGAACLKSKLLGDRAFPIDTATWNRYRRIRPHLPRKPISTLNIGPGEGVETLRFMRPRHSGTTAKIERATAEREREGMEWGGNGSHHRRAVGHVLQIQIELNEQFDEIVVCEVLAQILDDQAVVALFVTCLTPGDRVVLSTPTVRHGQLPGDRLSTFEDGNHAPAGYDGPNLDAMLSAVGRALIQRGLNTNAIVGCSVAVDRIVRRRADPLAIEASLLARGIYPILDVVPIGWTDQITIGVKH